MLFTKKGRVTNWLIAVVIGFTMIACSDSSTGSNGGDGDNGGNGDDNTIGTEPTFTNVGQILTQSCGGSGCHIGERTNGVRLDSYNNVINSTGDTYGKLIVQPDDADASPIIDKLEPNPDFGVRMPENGNFLSQARIDQIKEWINNGAENN